MRIFFLVNLIFTINICGAEIYHHDRVLLSDVETLTFNVDSITNRRRTAASPQLQCIGGTAAGQDEPKVAQCYNRGSDGNDIQWECNAVIDKQYRFGRMEVNCEGYDFPDDPYILRGSCRLQYILNSSQLELTPWQAILVGIVILVVIFLMVFILCAKDGGEFFSSSRNQDRYESVYQDRYEQPYTYTAPNYSNSSTTTGYATTSRS